MWKKSAIAATILTGSLFLAACAAGDASGEDAAENLKEGGVQKAAQNMPDEKVEPAQMEGELTILTFSPWENNWKYLIEEFNKVYPNVKIILDKPSEEEGVNVEKFVTKVMTGEGYDIVDSDWTASEKYESCEGLFVDLYEYMNNDGDFDREDYFPCIFEPMELNGKLFRLNRNVCPIYIRLNKKLLEEAGVEYTKEMISFKDMYDIYVKVRENTGKTALYMKESGNYEPMSNYENAWYFRNNQYDSEEYEEYLRMNHDLYYTEEYRSSYSEYGQGMKDDALCRDIAAMNLQDASLVNKIFAGTEDITGLIPYVGAHGERYVGYTSSLSIARASENKALAWEFLKFTISNREFIGVGTAISPNRERVNELCERLDPETVERLLKDIEAVNAIPLYDMCVDLSSITEDYYLNNTITAKECGKQMAERVYLYMNE